VLQYFYYMDAKITIDYKEKGSKFPVAVEFGTTDYLYLHKRKQDKEEEKPIKNRYDLKFKDYEEAIKRNGIKGKEKHSVMEHLEEMYFSNIQGDDKYKDLQKIVEEKEGKKFKAKKKLIPVLRKNWFDVVYINGRSGAGKTKFLVRMVNAYLKTLTKKRET
jgi:flagellar biosynthesis GTPase FlhF